MFCKVVSSSNLCHWVARKKTLEKLLKELAGQIYSYYEYCPCVLSRYWILFVVFLKIDKINLEDFLESCEVISTTIYKISTHMKLL